MLKKNKFIILLLAVFLLFGTSIGVFATIGGKAPTAQSGEYGNPVADRVYFSVKNTSFSLKKNSADSEKFTITVFFSAKKTQADFYAILNSFTFSGLSYDSMVFTALNADTEGKTANSTLLPAKDGEPVLLEWQVDITFNIVNKGTYNTKILLDFTSGLSEATAQQKLTEIPVTITVS